ncbi:trypsin-like peptidase domain-containing protein, partial [Pseudomonas aeruginosa]
MMVMAPGANTALGAAQCSWTLECGNPSAFGDYAAVALLPLDDKRHPKGEAALFQVSQAWMQWSGGQEKICCNLNLGQLPTGADRVLLVVYTFSAMGPVSDLRLLRLQIDS